MIKAWFPLRGPEAEVEEPPTPHLVENAGNFGVLPEVWVAEQKTKHRGESVGTAAPGGSATVDTGPAGGCLGTDKSTNNCGR